MEVLLKNIQLSDKAIELYLRCIGQQPLSSFELYSILPNITKEDLNNTIKELIESFELLAVHYDMLHLLLVGDQDQRRPLSENIMASINNHKHIHLLPDTDDLPGYLAVMDIFVLASRL